MERFDNFDLENLTVQGNADDIVVVTLSRPNKRNALNAETIEELITVFSQLPRLGARAAVLKAEGPHFCAGLDLVEHHNKKDVQKTSCTYVFAGTKHLTKWNTVAYPLLLP